MKRLLVLGLIGSFSFAIMNPMIIENQEKFFQQNFIKNFVEINNKKTKLSKILEQLSNVLNKKFILLNKNKDFVISLKKNYRIYNLSDLNKLLVKNGYPYLIKIMEIKNNVYHLKIVSADTLNAYDVKGVRLTKDLKIKDVFEKLNKEQWTQAKYEGKNFEIPANPQIVIKNLMELQKYLNATSNYSIFLKKAVDINNDNVTDIEIWGQTITMKYKGETPKEAIIRHLQIIKKLANGIKSQDFNKELFKQDIEQTIEELKSLK